MMSNKFECYFSLYVQFFSCAILQLVTKVIFMFINIYMHAHSFGQSLLTLKRNLLVLCTGGCFLIMGRTWWINSWDIDSTNWYLLWVLWFQASALISKLNEEKNSAIQQNNKLQQELVRDFSSEIILTFSCWSASKRLLIF